MSNIIKLSGTIPSPDANNSSISAMQNNEFVFVSTELMLKNDAVIEDNNWDDAVEAVWAERHERLSGELSQAEIQFFGELERRARSA